MRFSWVLDNLNLIFDKRKNMARFVTDLLQYLRDLIIVKTKGKIIMPVSSLLKISRHRRTLLSCYDWYGNQEPAPISRTACALRFIHRNDAFIRLAETSSHSHVGAYSDEADELKGWGKSLIVLPASLANGNGKPGKDLSKTSRIFGSAEI